MIELTNFPKIKCPFVRKEYGVNEDDWKKYGNELQIGREPKVYLVTPEIEVGYEWVFGNPYTVAVEKLDGTNVKLLTEKGKLLSLYNRKNPIDLLDVINSKGRIAIIEGILRAIGKGFVEKDGEQAGEVIGKNINKNIYGLEDRVWYPFEKAVKDLSYRSFHEHDKTFENFSSWFKDYLFSRFAGKKGNKIFAEGVVFYDLKKKEKESMKVMKAKLRRDMFSHFYSDKIEIYDYPY